MSGLNINVIHELQEYGKESLYDAIEEVESGFSSIQRLKTNLIEESKVIINQIISRLNSYSFEEECSLDYRLILFEGLSSSKEVRQALEKLPISMIGLSNRAINALARNQVSNIYEAIIKIKTVFKIMPGIGKKTVIESIQTINDLLIKIRYVDPKQIENELDPRVNYFSEANGNFLSVFKDIISVYFEKQESKKLKDRNKNILLKRFNLDGEGFHSQVDIGVHYDVSRQRIEQIESTVLGKIERLLSGKLETKGWRLDKKIIDAYIELRVLLNSKDFLISNSDLLSILNKSSHGKFNQNYLHLLMKILGYFPLPKTFKNFRGSICDSWCRVNRFKPKEIESLYADLDEAFENIEPIKLFDLIVKVKKNSKNKFSNDEIHLALKFCPEVEVKGDELHIKIEFLKSITDKAYKILYSHNDSMHYSEIMKEINSLGHNNNTVKQFNLTNQLSSDDRFVSIGKSGYWRLNKGETLNNESVIKIMEKVLHKLSTPSTSKIIVKETQKIRPNAKEKSIKTYLSNRDIFTRISKSKFGLATWKMDAFEGQSFNVKFSKFEFYEKAYEILKNNNPVPLVDFVKQMLSVTDLKERTIRQKIDNSKLLLTRPLSLRRKEVFCKNLDTLKKQIIESQNITIRDKIQTRILEILTTKKEPITKGELYKEVSRNCSCVRSTFYRYLSEINEIRQFNHNNMSYVEVIVRNQTSDDSITFNELQKLRNDIFKLSSEFAALKDSSESKNVQIDEIYRLLDKESENTEISKYESQLKSEFPQFAQLEDNSIKFLESSYYLYDKLNDIKEADFSPYILQFSRVIENELLNKLFITFSRNFDSNEDKSNILENEMKSFKTKIFAKYLQNNNEKYTLGTMVVIIGYVYKSNGNTLNNSKLLQIFRLHVTSLINSDFLCKKNMGLLSNLTSNYRNKAAHTEIITLDVANEFTEIVIDLLTSLLNSYKII